MNVNRQEMVVVLLQFEAGHGQLRVNDDISQQGVDGYV
jgi:hypothetical protein